MTTRIVPDESAICAQILGEFPMRRRTFAQASTCDEGTRRRWSVSTINAKESRMPVTIGFNHVATLTTNMNRTVAFYEHAFDAVVVFEMAKNDDHPWMKIVDVGGGAALNIFEVDAEALIGERQRQGGHGAIDHFAFMVDSRATLDVVRQRLADAGADEVGDIQQLGSEWSLFFRDPDGMELEVCCPA